jgi:hypothetical protein
VRESDIEGHLVQRVGEIGGMIRKVQWIGRRGCPDRAVFYEGQTYWVELKRPGGIVSWHQEREFTRMFARGVKVHVLDSFEQVEQFICKITGK